MKETISIKHNISKRLFDILFSLLVIIAGFPIYLLLTLLVAFSSPGPILYYSLRVGRGGKLIRCVKFRTMYSDADRRLSDLLSQNPTLKKEWDTFQKLKIDPRITPLGHFLRKYSLDELPQFWNVLKGDLSVVGPRPMVLIGPKEAFQQEIRKYLGNRMTKILSVRPGLTGIWQTSGRSEIGLLERVALEEKYIDSQSFYRDLVLICKTIPAMLFSKGAY